MKPLIVIPAYNEVTTIAGVVEKALTWAPVAVIDDGSTDGTAKIASAAGADVVSHARRLGKGQAIRTGIATARARGASVMLTLDADGQHDPDDIPALLEAARLVPRAIVVASRYHDKSALTRGRRNASQMASFFVAWAGNMAVRDTQSGFRAYPLALFDELPLRRGGFVFETEVLLAATADGWPIVEIDVSAIPRACRPSRFRPVVDGAAVVTYLAQQMMRRSALEARAALREVLSVVSGERRRARHRSMLDAAAPYADAPGSWTLALGVAALRHASDCLTSWWHNPRARRAALAARATAMTPVVLGAAALQGLAGRWAPDLVSPLVEHCFAPELLEQSAHVGSEPRESSRSRSMTDERLTVDSVPQS